MCSVLCGCDRGGPAEEPGWTTEYPAGVQSKGPGESPGGGKSEKSVLCKFVSSHSKRPVLCSWRVGGLPHVGPRLSPLPERSTPLAPSSADGGRGGEHRTPPHYSILLPPTRLSRRHPAVTLCSHFTAKWAHFCYICRCGGKRLCYCDCHFTVGRSQPWYMTVVVHECGHLKAAPQMSSGAGLGELLSHSRRHTGWSHCETRETASR